MTETAVLGGGCFWCVEAAFKKLTGVKDVTSGYAGGHSENPSYREVCTGETGHAEVVKIEYDESEISYEDILELFFGIHDPTTKDRQGPDKGTQYRSIILYKDENQAQKAERFIREKQREYTDKILTEVEPLGKFYSAEEKHQNYFQKNPNDAYCRIHARPKVEKANEFAEQLVNDK